MKQTLPKNASRNDSPNTSDGPGIGTFRALHLAVILSLTFGVYMQSLTNDFILAWDDMIYIISNDAIQSLSFQNIVRIFTTIHAANYHPLTTLTWAVEYALAGNNPTIYHSTNLLLHGINIILLYYIILRLTDRSAHAALVAVLFAVHPLNVEVVAFVSQRKDVLYTMFFFLALRSYLLFREDMSQKHHRYYCLFFFLCALLSKSMAVTLPLVLLLLDYYQGERIGRKTIVEKLPFFVLSFIFGVVAIYSQKSYGAVAAVPDFTLLDRFFLTCYAVLFYIVKLVAPFHLSAMHGYPLKINGWLPWTCYVAPAVIFLPAWGLWKTKRREWIFGAVFFLITIAPVLQVLPVGGALVSERYTYVPGLGLFFLTGSLYCHWLHKKGNRFNGILYLGWILTGAVVLIFSFTAWNRTKVWADSITLWSDVIDKNPTVAVAYYNRGVSRFNSGAYTMAIADYDKAIQYHPKYLEAYLNRGESKAKVSDVQGALKDYTAVIRMKPGHRDALLKRSRTKASLQDYDGAIADLDVVLSQGEDTGVYAQRANLKIRLQRYEEAKRDLDRILSLDPRNASAYNNRGTIEAMQGNFEKARNDFSRALSLRPGYRDAENNLKRVQSTLKKR